ncbi:putative cytochrome P450 family protein [Lyophyllum shimeji]|uniref:Cytochrome P450 family protein n=1 Tax=Lyophyllum shimeji TaxID=47721 RepID=A0A9P3USI6_LYOSH|nr:putative cytochrome P450 family protein [Lyophyllum shimeji]
MKSPATWPVRTTGCGRIPLRLIRLSRSSLPLPPGPKKLPLLGNALQMPASRIWETFHKWSKESGSDIIHLDVLGTSIVVLNSEQATLDLFEKRATIYSSRPHFVMAGELIGWNFLTPLLPYGEHWRAHRRIFHQEFNATACRRFRPDQLNATHRFLQKLLDSPEQFMRHIRHLAGEVTMSTTYGIQIRPVDDPNIDIAERAIRTLAKSAAPGKFLVDAVPLLKFYPSFLPGGGFKTLARKWRMLCEAFRDVAFDTCKQEISTGSARPSFVRSRFMSADGGVVSAAEEQFIRESAASMYAAGTETTISPITLFFLLMVLCPEVQKKAQEEIDRSLEPGHLPDFHDEDRLPYITAIVKELFRWGSTLPLAVPHLSVEEDVYRGYRIPAGSTVISNLWGILHDEAVYPNAAVFWPDRFIKDGKLDKSIKDPLGIAFGIGRRVCPGLSLAFYSVWIAVASTLAAFEITKTRDQHGNLIEPPLALEEGIAVSPLPFKCSIKPRTQQVEWLIRSARDDDEYLCMSFSVKVSFQVLVPFSHSDIATMALLQVV